MRRLEDDAECGSTSTAESEEQVLILTLIRGAEDTVRSDYLHLDLVVHHMIACTKGGGM